MAWVRRLAVRATTALVAMTAEGAGAATALEAAQLEAHCKIWERKSGFAKPGGRRFP